MLTSSLAICTPDQHGYLGERVILYNLDDIDKAATDVNIVGQIVSSIVLLSGKSYYTCTLRKRNNGLSQSYRLGEYLNDFDNIIELNILSGIVATKEWFEELRFGRYVALVEVTTDTVSYWEMIGYELGLSVTDWQRVSNGDLENGMRITLACDNEYKESNQSYIVQSIPLPVSAPAIKGGIYSIPVPLTMGTAYTFTHTFTLTNATFEAFTVARGQELVGILKANAVNLTTQFDITPAQDYAANELQIRCIGN